MTNKKDSFLNIPLYTFLKVVLLLFVFIISIFLGGLYNGGDQIIYQRTYSGLSNLNLADAYLFYTFNIYSIEIIHFVAIWIASHLGINKIIFMAVCNTFLANLIIKVFNDLKVNFLITSLFITTNFYLYVLFFAAERLKFGFIFFLIAILYKRNSFHKTLFFMLSILSHLQMIILYSGKIFDLSLTELKRFITSLELRKSLFLITPFVFISFLFIQSDLLIKIIAYSDSKGLSDFLRISLFLIMALYYSSSKLKTLVYFVPLFIAVYFVGEDRVNMIGYIYFLYSALQYRNGFNLGVLATTLYFLYININFVKNIILYGNGFHS